MKESTMPQLPQMDNLWNRSTSDYEMTGAEKKALLHRLNSEHSDAWEYQSEARRRWDKLENYCAGRQAWDKKTGQYVGHEVAGAETADNNVDEEYFIFNTTGRIASSNVQRLSAYSIQPNVVPNSSNPKDKAGARAGRIALSDMFNKIGEKKLKRRTAVIIGKYGSVFFKNYFDPSRGRIIHPVKLDSYGKPFIDESVLEPEGEAVIEAFSPRNIILPRFCRELESADWIEEVHVESTAWVWRKFQIKVDAEKLDYKDGYGPTATDLDQKDTEWGQYMPQDGVVVKARYVNPCPDYARGAIIFYTEKHILRCTDMLTYVDSLQDVWSSASAIEDEKTPFGTSWLWDIIPVQDGLNTDLTAIINHIKMYGDLQTQAPATANVKLDKITNATGQHYTYTGEKGLDYLRPPELQSSHFSVFTLLNNLGMSLGAAHDISRSNKALSGNALATLQQIDDTVLRPCLESIGEGLEKSCKGALKLMAEYYTNERLMKMTGMQGWEILEGFKGELLNGNYDARVSLMTGLSNNPIVRQESIYKALKEGVIDVQEARIHMEFGNSDRMLEEIQKENEIADNVVQGIADFPANYVRNPQDGSLTCKVIPHMWDNHELIVKRLLVFMRENYDHMEPEVKGELQKQLEWHQAVMAQLARPAEAPAADGMTPERGFGLPPMPAGGPGAGPMSPEQAPGADSVQATSQQPDRSKIPAPAATGMAQA